MDTEAQFIGQAANKLLNQYDLGVPVNNYSNYSEFIRGQIGSVNTNKSQTGVHIFHDIDSYNDREQLCVAELIAQNKCPIIALGSTGINSVLWTSFDFALQATGREFPQPDSVLQPLIPIPHDAKNVYISGNIRSYIFAIIHAFTIKKFSYKDIDVPINVVNCEDQIIILSKVFAHFEGRKFILPEDVQAASRFTITTKLVPLAIAKVTNDNDQEDLLKQMYYSTNSLLQQETIYQPLGFQSQMASMYQNSNLSRINSLQKVKNDSSRKLNNHLAQAQIQYTSQSSYDSNTTGPGQSNFTTEQSSFNGTPRQLWRIPEMDSTIQQIIDSVEVV